MIRTLFFSSIFFSFLTPSFVFAAEQSLLPALCQQITTPNPDTSVSKIIIDRVVTRAKEIPNEVMKDVEEVGDKLATTVNEKLESKKSASSNAASSNLTAGVLGAHTQIGWFDRAYDAALGVLQTLIKHWVYTMAGLGAAAIYFLFRF